ncbi:nSTAND1 domain-containing NTPase [Streptomyces sp. NPDC003015]
MGRREKPLDPGAGAVQRFAYELRKLRDEAGTPTYRVMAAGAGYSAPTLSAAAAGERLPTLPVLLAYVTACGGDPGEWEGRWRKVFAESADARVIEDADDEDSPYPGLARFETGDGEHFHGRDDLIAELGGLTAAKRFVGVTGASGSGKSSFLRAGLIPALRSPSAARGPHLATIRLLTPGSHPLRTHRALFTPHDGPGDTLLVVDQFEELFTLCADAGERAEFLGQLLTAADPASRLRAVIAVRADFYGRCAEHGPLAEALRDSTLLVGPLPPAALREAVVRPAAAQRLVVERALTARIVADVAGEPGGLPLMAHAVREVWRRRTGRTLTLAAYEAVGGVRGAVAHTAEAVHARCTPAEAAALRRLLLRMVHPGDGTEDTRRPVDRAELDMDGTTAHVLELLVRNRLLTVDGTTVDLAHEALLGAWPRLRGWLDEDRERLRLHRGLTEAALAWDAWGRDAGALYRGTRLTRARETFGDGPDPGDVGELNRLERDFLVASVDAHERGRRAAVRAVRRLRTLTAALAVLLCLAVIAGVAAWRQSGVSARQRDEAEARGAAELADTLRQSDPRTAAHLGLAAWKVADLPETRRALRTAAAQSERDVFTAPEEDGRAIDAPTWLGNNGRILTTLVRDKVVQWDVATRRRIRSVEWPGLSEDVVAVSEDGRLVARREPGGTDLVVGSLADGTAHRFATGPATDSDAAFGPDGRTLLVRRLVPGERATLTRWDVRRQRVLFRYQQGTGDGALPAQSRDGRYLAWCTDSGGQPRILDTAAGHLVATPVPTATGRALCQGDELTFTADSQAVATATSTGVVTWDIRPGRERPRLPLPDALRVEFAGDYAVTWTVGSLALWRLDLPAAADDSPREPLLTFPVDTSALGDLRLDPGAGVLRYREQGRTASVHTLSLQGLTGGAWRDRAARTAAFDIRGRPTRVKTPVTVNGEETVTVDLAGRTALTSEGTLVDISTGRPPKGRAGIQGEDYLTEGAFSPDGRYLAAADVQGRVTLWDAHHWRRLAVLRSGGSNRHKLTLGFSADGSLVAASEPDGSVNVWETATPALPAATLPVGDSPVLALGFTSRGEELHVATPHLADRAYPLEPDRAARTVCARTLAELTRTQWRRWFPSADHRQVCGT